jgi:hypothetical protein
MARVEAVLTYRPDGLGSDVPTAIGATSDPSVLRLARDRVLQAAHKDAQMWLGVDSGVAALKVAEAERLTRVLAVLLPDEELRAELRLVPSPERPGA